MKRIISLFLVFAFMFGLCACGNNGEFEQDEYAKAQAEVIQNLSVSLENRRIVAYRGENDHLIYVVVEYDENVRKVSETTYYFCYNESVYNYMLPDFKNEKDLKEIKDKIYFTFTSDKASTGTYEMDVNKLKKEFTVV